MILIAHRGNINNKNTKEENSPNYIDAANKAGYDVEIDIWAQNNQLYLGHDMPLYNIDQRWINDRWNFLWIHCKNLEAIEYFDKFKSMFNYFWHESDTLTLTSKNYIWAYPGKQPIKKSIAVLPEIYNDDLSQCIGICSDNIANYNIQ